MNLEEAVRVCLAQGYKVSLGDGLDIVNGRSAVPSPVKGLKQHRTTIEQWDQVKLLLPDHTFPEIVKEVGVKYNVVQRISAGALRRPSAGSIVKKRLTGEEWDAVHMLKDTEKQADIARTLDLSTQTVYRIIRNKSVRP